MNIFMGVSLKKKEQLFMEAKQILTHASYELNLSESAFRFLLKKLNLLYIYKVPRLKPKTVVAAVILLAVKDLGIFAGTQKLSIATGCSREWLKKLKFRLNGPYKELTESIRSGFFN